MARKFEFRKGFLRLQRLGPIKFGEQSRWSVRAPEKYGMWAFPYPHFDLFYAYHKYTDLAPKDLRNRWPEDPKWYWKDYDTEEPVDKIEFREVHDYFGVELRPHYLDETGVWQEASLKGDFWTAREEWVEKVGKKILPLRDFWYDGYLYTHFNRDGSVGSWTMNSNGQENDWTLMSTHELARILQKPGAVVDFDGNYDGSGKPRTYAYSKDHLEVFIPRNQGKIRAKV